MLAEELARVEKQLHPDPHTVLGPHPADTGDGFVVRVLRADATAVRVVPAAGAATRAKRLRGTSFFEARFASDPGRYVVETTYPDRVETKPDPYSFSPVLGEIDLHLFAEGRHAHIHDRLGAHLTVHEGVAGVSFAVWAPNALGVRVVGDFNAWSGKETAMRRLGGGVWELFLPEITEGALYKFEVATRRGPVDKSDPFGRSMELRPSTASRVVRSTHVFRDEAWIAARADRAKSPRPMSIYEVHLGSWKRRPTESSAETVDAAADAPPPDRSLTYRELARELVDYVKDLGFTHIELLPITEYPYDGSWGYQVSGYFAPTSRLGSADDLKYFVDRCHEQGIGVLLDWVPAHFPRDSSALGRFDGTPQFEHWDPRRGEHRQWETFVFDWGKPEVKNFLIASATYWLEEFHVDGLRVDAVASMLYLDYGASHPSEWEPNVHGGRENLEAVAFLRELNDTLHERFPGVIVAAEESTSWPGVTKPTYTGGLGFDLKWNMGWMHDTLHYFGLDPIFRSFNHNLITFAIVYAYSERYLLPLSHDEVVHLKRSLLGKLPGDPWKMRANLRALFSMMWAHPGKKLLFMGGEIGQLTEWNFGGSLPWHLLDDPGHRGISALVRDLNRLLGTQQAMYELDDDPRGFTWIDANDSAQSVASYIRFPRSTLKRRQTGTHVVFVGNFTPLVRYGYRVGVPRNCDYREALNSDAAVFGGSNIGNLGTVKVERVPSHGFEQSIRLTLPPLGALFLLPVDPGDATAEELAEEEAERKKRPVTPPAEDGHHAPPDV